MVDTNFVIRYYTRQLEEGDHACTIHYWCVIEYLFIVCTHKSRKILTRIFEQMVGGRQ